MKPVEQILAEIRPELDYHASTDFIADGMLDSFDVVTLVNELEREYGIVVPGVAVIPENFSSIGNIEALVQKQIGAF